MTTENAHGPCRAYYSQDSDTGWQGWNGNRHEPPLLAINDAKRGFLHEAPQRLSFQHGQLHSLRIIEPPNRTATTHCSFHDGAPIVFNDECDELWKWFAAKHARFKVAAASGYPAFPVAYWTNFAGTVGSNTQRGNYRPAETSRGPRPRRSHVPAEGHQFRQPTSPQTLAQLEPISSSPH